MKSIIYLVFTTFLSTMAMAQEKGSGFGLTERRAAKKFEDSRYPELLKRIQDAAGFAVPVEIKWETIAKPGMSEFYDKDEFWVSIYFIPLEKSFSAIAVDQDGKAGLKKSLKKIVIDYNEKTAPSSAYEDGLKFENGVLSINFEPYTNATEAHEGYRAKAIEVLVSSKL
ncbi:MAG: hypothetical protein ACRCVT_09650 [Leadbetterella sp.]